MFFHHISENGYTGVNYISLVAIVSEKFAPDVDGRTFIIGLVFIHIL